MGDIINMQGDWALADWYPNYRPTKSTKGGNGTDKQEDKQEDVKEPAEVSA